MQPEKRCWGGGRICPAVPHTFSLILPAPAILYCSSSHQTDNYLFYLSKSHPKHKVSFHFQSCPYYRVFRALTTAQFSGYSPHNSVPHITWRYRTVRHSESEADHMSTRDHLLIIPNRENGCRKTGLWCNACARFALLLWYLPADECACMPCYAFVCNVGKES